MSSPLHLEELLASAKPALPRLRASGNPEAGRAETCVLIAARHVASARLGVSLYDSPTALEAWAGGATVQTAALLMVFGSGQTSVDLCASGLHRLRGDLPPPAREHDFGALRDRVAKGRVTLSEAERVWFETINDSDEGRDLWDFRGSILHRIVRQSVTVRVGGGRHSSSISPSSGKPGDEEAAVTLDRHAGFVELRWREFVETLGP